MRLGIDIDNVISNFDSELLKEYIEYDKNLRNTGIVNKQAKYIRDGMFDWTDDEDKLFYKNNIERIAKKLGVIDGAKEYIDRHNVIFVNDLYRNKIYQDFFIKMKQQ